MTDIGQNLTMVDPVVGRVNTMTSQVRYSTLVKNLGRIYASEEGALQRGLDEIMSGIKPVTSDDWNIVKKDSERLLHVWNVKENGAIASEMMRQIRDMLGELSKETVADPSIRLEVTDKVTHIDGFREITVPVQKSAFHPNPVVHVHQPVEADVKTVQIHIREVEEEEEEIAEADRLRQQPSPTGIAEEVLPEEEEIDEEVVEPAEEEEEEEAEEGGLEVEQYVSRGRTYWLDVKTQDLYANLEGDEVGDHIGALVNGKPVFLAT